MGRLPVGEQPPPSLDQYGRSLWRATLASLQRQGTWVASDRETLSLYIFALCDAHRARARIADRALVDGDGVTSVGSAGQPIVHPDTVLLRQAERDASAYSDQLLLNPKSRRRAGLKIPTHKPGRLAEALGTSLIDTV